MGTAFEKEQEGLPVGSPILSNHSREALRPIRVGFKTEPTLESQFVMPEVQRPRAVCGKSRSRENAPGRAGLTVDGKSTSG